MKTNNNSEKGNVLFLILIAVALFAALSYAVTQSSRSGGDAGRETNILNSAQLSQYPNQIRTAILRQVIDGIDIFSIRFNAPADFDDLDGTTGRIGVFHPNGGGAVFQDASVDMMANGSPGQWTYNLEFEVPDIGLSVSSGIAGNDLIAFLPGVTLSVCQRINLEAGISSDPSANPPVIATTVATAYAENMVDDGTTDYSIPSGESYISLDTDPDTDDVLTGRPFGCFRNTSSGDYVYYHVLNER